MNELKKQQSKETDQSQCGLSINGDSVVEATGHRRDGQQT